MRISKIDAILSLSPGAEVVVRGEEVEWLKPSTAPVTEAEIDAELVRLQALNLCQDNVIIEYDQVSLYRNHNDEYEGSQ
jgi:hypothetical protein